MKIKLNDHVSMDLDKLVESRLLVQANSGGGKSWAIRRIIEQAFGHVQIIVIDPEGEFGNMRSKFDFAYAGKGGDTPVESRSAALLATRLLELKASTIVDLYELPPQERKHFVKLFCEAMVNAPKELWHDTLVIIDEAHVFAPEKGESEAMGSVIDLATRGRKRGYCVILATQRLPKLNKDAAAECNNKLIGRASQDIDRKRASEELGFSSREQLLSLRDLAPGEFYAFGPAISREVQKIEIGDVSVKPAKRGVSRMHVPAPSAKVRQMLAKLADLPQEAAQEAKTVAEIKGALAAARREITNLQRTPIGTPEAIKKAIREEVAEAEARKDRALEAFKKALYQKLLKSHGNVFRALEALSNDIDTLKQESNDYPLPKDFKKLHALVKVEQPLKGSKQTYLDIFPVAPLGMPETDTEKVMGAGERQVLIAVAQMRDDGMTREHITVQTGYKRSTRDAYIQRLFQKGYVKVGARVWVRPEGIEALGNDYEPLPTGNDLLQYHLKKLPQGEAKVLSALYETLNELTRDEISEMTGFKRSTRDAYIQRLATRQLVRIEGQTIRISEHLL